MFKCKKKSILTQDLNNKEIKGIKSKFCKNRTFDINFKIINQIILDYILRT